MNTYEALLYLATEPYEGKVSLHCELISSDAIVNELKKELGTNSLNAVDIRQASETMVYKN